MHSATTAPMLGEIRHDWTCEQIESLFALPFQDLIFEAQRIHREHHSPEHRADEHAAVGEDRRLPGRLRLLPAKRARTKPASTVNRCSRSAKSCGPRKRLEPPARRVFAWVLRGAHQRKRTWR
jgi:hypothetical protein